MPPGIFLARSGNGAQSQLQRESPRREHLLQANRPGAMQRSWGRRGWWAQLSPSSRLRTCCGKPLALACRGAGALSGTLPWEGGLATNAGAIQVSPWEGAQPHRPRLPMPVTVTRCWRPSPPEHPELSARASSRRNCNRATRALAVPARRIPAAATEAESVAGSGSGPPGGRPRASPLGSP